MPVTVQKLNRGDGDRLVSIPIGIDVLNIGYNREKYTPAIERELREKMENKLPGCMLAGFLVNLLTSWDVVEPADGEQKKIDKLTASNGRELSIDELKAEGIKFTDVPLTEITLDTIVSVQAQSLIVEKLSEDQRPNMQSSDFTSNT